MCGTDGPKILPFHPINWVGLELVQNIKENGKDNEIVLRAASNNSGT
jgi:hypothetical protein